ncbi:MAG: polysaccharide deacetylase [Lachnospiraceae bacterium]|nr:polysaccharide deacetylase [Lachnospiraceae bacterium]
MRYIGILLITVPILNNVFVYDVNPSDLDCVVISEEESVKENEVIAADPNVYSDPVVPGNLEMFPAGTVKRAYLTFDDGPSVNTDAILAILNAYGVKASFFVNNKTDPANIERYRMIAAGGHTLGLHSTSHVYSQVYKSADAFVNDFAANQAYVASVTGVIPTIYRFPGGSNNSVSPLDNSIYENILNSAGVKYYDWNVSAGDAVRPAATKSAIVSRVLGGCDSKGGGDVMILMHDLPEKKTTVEALPEIIEGLVQRGYVILPIDPTATSTTPTFHFE